jgi:hypothetical protein
MKSKNLMLLAVMFLALVLIYSASAAVDRVAWLQGVQLENGSSNLAVGGTPTAISWTTVSSVDAERFIHSFMDPTRLVLREPGDYLIAATLPINLGSGDVQRATQAIEVYVNGAPAPGAIGQSSYLRNTGSHTEASAHLTAVLTGLQADDVIELRTYRVAQNNASVMETIMETASIYVEKIEANRNVFTGVAAATVGGDNLNRDEFSGDNGLAWTAGRKDAGFTHSGDSSEIVLDETGSYLVMVNVPLTGTVNRTSVALKVLVDGVKIPNGIAEQGYIRNSNGHAESSLHWAGLVTTIAAGQMLELQTFMNAASGTVTIPANLPANIYIEKIDVSSGVLATSMLDDEFDFNTVDKTVIPWSYDEIIDEAAFGHGVIEEIFIKQAGSYLLTYNDALWASSSRPAPRITVEVNGDEVLGAQTKTHYIRNSGGHNYSSGSLVFLLEDLALGDIVTVSTQREANSGVVWSREEGDAGALLLLQYKEPYVPDPNSDIPPTLTKFTGGILGFEINLMDIGLGVDTDSIAVSLNGNPVQVAAVKQAGVTTISYAFSDFPAPNSTHAVTLTYNDDGEPAQSYQYDMTFEVMTQYTKLPAVYASPTVDNTKPGFIANVTQISANVHGGTHIGAENQLAGTLVDPATGEIWINEADFNSSAGVWSIDPVEIETVINWEQDSMPAGNFTVDNSNHPDDVIPNIPGLNGSTDGIVAEILTFLELEAGFYTFGVNSDDGFKVTCGASVYDVTARVTGIFDDNRSAADTLFNVVVEEDGFYPFRLLWWEAGGGASVEFFSVVDGEKILINDRSNPKAIKAYRAGPEIPYISRLVPRQKGLTDKMEIDITNTSYVVNNSSITLTIGGEVIQPMTTQFGKVVTMVWDPPGDYLPRGDHQVALSYEVSTDPFRTIVQEFELRVPHGQPAVLFDEPVRYWRLSDPAGETATSEVTGLDNEAISHGDYGGQPGFGAFSLVPYRPDDLAVSFNSSGSDVIIAPNGGDININNGPWDKKSWELWFKASEMPAPGGTGLGATKGLFEQGGGDRTVSIYLWRDPNNDNPDEAQLIFQAVNNNTDGDGLSSPWGTPDDATDDSLSTFVGTTVQVDTTYHVVAVLDGDSAGFEGSMILYVNGAEAGRIGGIGQLYNHSSDVQIGRGNGRIHTGPSGAFGFFDGVIDDVAIYNSALSAEQIATHYAQATQTSEHPHFSRLVKPENELGSTFEVDITHGVAGIVADSIKVVLDGAEVTPTITSTDLITTVVVDNGEYFPGGTHTVEVSFDEAGDPPITKSTSFQFRVPRGQIVVLEDNPIAYWRLGEAEGEDAISEIGAGLTGTYVNTPGLGAERLVVGDGSSAVLFDAALQQHITIADHQDINVSTPTGWLEKTIEIWFKARNLPSSASLHPSTPISESQVLYEQGGVTRGLTVYLRGTEPGPNPAEAELWFNAINRAEEVWGGTLPYQPEDVDGNILDPNSDPVAISTTIQAGQTYHLVLVMKGDDSAVDSFNGTITGYLNGEKFGEAAGVHILYNHSDNIAIGGVNGEASFHDFLVDNVWSPADFWATNPLLTFDGWIDEFALYNTALTETDVTEHYQAGMTEVPPDGEVTELVITAIALGDGNITISWEGAATLQEASEVSGPYTDIQGSASPQTLPIVEGENRFFRLVR